MIKDKKCSKCGNPFPATLNYFFRSYGTLDGLTSACINCNDNNYKEANVVNYDMSKIPGISDELAAFYKKVADSLATKHLIKNEAP